MGFDKVKIRQICFLVLYVAVVVLLLIYSNTLFAGLALGLKILMPFLVGAAIAFVLNIPMNFIENKIFKKWNGKSAKVLKRPISMVLSIILILAILILVFWAMVPQLRSTITTLGNKIPIFWKKIVIWVENLTVDYPELSDIAAQVKAYEFDWASITASVGGFLTNGVGSVLSTTITFAGSILSGIVNGFISIVFAIYILASKDDLQGQACRILDAYTKGETNARIRDVAARLRTNFTNFICGQCLEAVILGLLFIIFMTIFRMPYAVMVGTLIAFTALIPIVGAFIGCGVGAFMIFIENPMQALWFLVLFLVLQQLEGNLIYPRVVGNSVGLPSIWVLASVTIGGSMFGVVGMLIFIPLMSTIYSLIRDDVNQRNEKKTGRKRGGNVSQPKLSSGGQKLKGQQSKEQQGVKTQQLKEKPADKVKQPKEQQTKELNKKEQQPQEVKHVKTQQIKEQQRENKENRKGTIQKNNKENSVQDSSTEDIIARLVAEGEAKVLDELGEDPNKQEQISNANKKKKYYYYRNKKRSR